MSPETGPVPRLLTLTAVLLLTTSWSHGRVCQDPSPGADLTTAWEAVSHAILRDRRSDVAAVLDFTTLVLRDATVLPRTLEIHGEKSLHGIEFVDEVLGLTGRVRTTSIMTFAHEEWAEVYLVTRIARDPVLQAPVRCEVLVRWLGEGSLQLELAVFSILPGRELTALQLADDTKFGGYEFTVHVDARESSDAIVHGKDLWHPTQTPKNVWEEQPVAEPLIEKARAVMRTARERFVRIQGGLRFD